MESLEPKVSICIPSYNGGKTIQDTLTSIINQTYKNIEILVVDNASTDDTIDIVKKITHQNPKIKLFQSEVNIGGEANFQRCFQFSTCEYTAIFHSDDVYEPTMIEKQVAFLESHPDVGAVFTVATDIDENGKRLAARGIPRSLLKSNKETFDFAEIFKAILIFGNFIICPSAMVRTKIYQDEIKIWDGKKYGTSADLDVWLRILKNHKIGIINESLMNYRVSSSSYSYRLARQKVTRHDIFLVLDDYVHNYAKELMNQNDWDSYRLLLLKDNINRAIVYLLQSNNLEARLLVIDIFKWANIKASMRSFIKLQFLMIGYTVYILSYLHLGNIGKKLLYKIRYRK